MPGTNTHSSGNAAARRKATRGAAPKVGRRSAQPTQPTVAIPAPSRHVLPVDSSDDDAEDNAPLHYARFQRRPPAPSNPTPPEEPARRFVALVNGSHVLFAQAFADPHALADLASGVDGTLELSTRVGAFLGLLSFLSTAFGPPAPSGLTKAQLKAKTQVRKPNVRDRGKNCAVCCSGLPGRCNLSLLPRCGHTFHTKCINPWLTNNHTCPLCRSNVLGDQSTSQETDPVASPAA